KPCVHRQCCDRRAVRIRHHAYRHAADAGARLACDCGRKGEEGGVRETRSSLVMMTDRWALPYVATIEDAPSLLPGRCLVPLRGEGKTSARHLQIAIQQVQPGLAP